MNNSDEYWENRLSMIIDKVKTWGIHIDGEVVKESEEEIEIKLPENLGLLRVDSNDAYITGLKRKDNYQKHKSPNYELRVFGWKDREKHPNMYRLNRTPKNLSVTIDDSHASAIEIHGTKSLFDNNKRFIKLEFFNVEENNFINNWNDMSEEEIKMYLSNIPESQHKRILIKELKAANILNP
jgi:hypothetical protein